jgi:hypothetical protein
MASLPFFILAHGLEFPGRTGVVKKIRFRNPARHDFLIPQIRDEFNAYSGEEVSRDLPAVEASADDTRPSARPATTEYP